MSARTVKTPVGVLMMQTRGEALCRIARVQEEAARPCEPSALLDEAQRQLEAYFAGRLREFDLPLDERGGSAFDREVWRTLRDIPYGTLRTYGELARALGRPGASRAVGGACARNPILIVTPCHRVVAGTGRLTGFAAGLDAKEGLLIREGFTIAGGRVKK